MRLGILFFVISMVVLLSICESKSTKKPSKKSKDVSKSVKSSQHGKSTVKHEAKTSKKSVSKKDKIPKKSKKDKIAKKDKPKAKAKIESKKKTSSDKTKKITTKKVEVTKKVETKKETLKAPVPSSCDDIVRQYTNGELIMYEFKIKMKRCLNGQKEDALRTALSSKYETSDDSAAFFRHAMKYVNDEGSANYDDDNDDADKKSVVPASDPRLMNTPITAADPASYYNTQGQNTYQQPQSMEQAAFNQDPMTNQAAPVQQNYDYYARSSIPAAPQTSQDISSQYNVQAAAKKDLLPAAPADDPFANFMNMQSTQITTPQATQQRNDIPAPQAPQQRSEIPIDAAYQAPSYPSMQQAYFRSPEDHGSFPENP